MIDILLQADPTIFKDATPYSSAIYGLLVVGCGFIIYYLAKRIDKKEAQTNALIALKDAEYKELAENTLVMITEIKEKILDIRDYRATVLAKLDDLYKEINRLKNNHE